MGTVILQTWSWDRFALISRYRSLLAIRWAAASFPLGAVLKEDDYTISIYLDYVLDESYTPQKIAIKAGNNALDLENVGILEVDEPKGWVELDLWVDDGQRIPLKTFYMEFLILANHQNGKDTHVRGIKLHSPPNVEIPFSTLEFQMHSVLR